MTRATFLLPAPSRFGAQRWTADIVRALGRADRLPDGDAGRRAQLLRFAHLPFGRWPLAALSRRLDAQDADAPGIAWLRADPAWLRPDINGVRLMAHGEGLGLTREDVDALLPALRPVFGDAGFPLDAPHPARWYLQVPAGTRLPAFHDPADALGADLADLDDEALDSGADARRWRALANEAQVTLHQHPWNARRLASGRPAVNALWFWGGGALPAQGLSGGDWPARVHTDDPTCAALAAASVRAEPLPEAWPGSTPEAALFDLTALRDLRELQQAWLAPALAALADGGLDTLEVDDESGRRLRLRRWHRLRIWRRAPRSPAA